MESPVCPCGEPHPPGAAFYVTCADGARVGWLAGPYADHPAALADVDRVRQCAERVDPFAHFYAFGTAGVVGGNGAPGVLNSILDSVT